MKTFVFLVVLVLFGLSIYFYCSKKEKCQTTDLENIKDKRIEKIQRAQKNLHPQYNKNADRGTNGRFKKKA